MANGHTPTRVDIQTSGWTSGTDMPLPRDCQTATCIHKDHQLSRAKADAELDAEWIRNAALEEAEKPNRGWVMPSSIFGDPTRTHREFFRRKWFKRGYQPPTGWLNVRCWDMECDKEHTSSLPLDPPLDLPTVSIRRGGLRHWPMLPDFQTRVTRKNRWHRWRVEARVYGGQPWQEIGRTWSWKHASDQASMTKRLNVEVYTRIKDHVIQHGW